MQDFIGRTLGHYRIVEKIGEGGMGEVYRAHDERLDRDVAVKVLPEAVTQDAGRLARFETEAKAVAKLAHPNILDVYELGDHEGRPFMATELLEGETLRERLGGASLGWRKATEIGAAIADGLGAAHEAGICHRDLKPSNVFITADGRVKVLDFGLARHRDAEVDKDVTHAPTITRQTDPGTVLGTVGYMSPEQVRAKTVDQRSDIFSLGCVLYEMVSGERAFTGNSAVETMNAILKEEPTDVSTSGGELPPELAGTIRRCLEKRPQARFQSASDLAYNLRTISSASVSSAAPGTPFRYGRGKWARWIGVAATAAIVIGVALIAVLRLQPHKEMPPSSTGDTLEWVAAAQFENRTGDASLDPVGQRAVDLTIQKFSEVGFAGIVRAIDAVPYPPGREGLPSDSRQREPATRQAGEKGPHVLVTGSYYLDGDNLELQARLTDYDTGELLYAFKPASAKPSDVAAALNDLCEQIVVAVQFHWSRQHDLRFASPPSSFESWVAFSYGWNEFGANYGEAITAFERALKIDPGFHFARISMIISYLNLGDIEKTNLELTTANHYYQEFTEFERAYFSMCKAWVNQKPVEALAHIRQMVRIAPHLPWSRYALGYAANQLNRPRESLDALRPILPTFQAESHPAAHWPLLYAIHSHHLLGEYQQSLDLANVGLDIFPDVEEFFTLKGGALAAMGRIDEARSVIEECTWVQLRGGGRPIFVMGWVALELRAHGYRQEADELKPLMNARWNHEWPGSDITSLNSNDLYAQSWVLRVADRWSEARTTLLELEKRGTSSIDSNGLLGVIAARTGNRDEAMRISDDLSKAEGDLDLQSVFYWRACIASHLGEEDRAVELLKEAFSRGMRFGLEYHIDVDIEPLWDYPPFQELIEPKG